MTEEEQIARRKEFYNLKAAGRTLAREGIPKNRQSMLNFIASASGSSAADGTVTEEQLECLSYVIFDQHPQQINVRDKASGKIIATIRR
jgi:hypothetical protein